jgi:hypothetical protein
VIVRNFAYTSVVFGTMILEGCNRSRAGAKNAAAARSSIRGGSDGAVSHSRELSLHHANQIFVGDTFL